MRCTGHFVQTFPEREGGLTDLDSVLVAQLLRHSTPAGAVGKDSPKSVIDVLPSRTCSSACSPPRRAGPPARPQLSPPNVGADRPQPFPTLGLATRSAAAHRSHGREGSLKRLPASPHHAAELELITWLPSWMPSLEPRLHRLAKPRLLTQLPAQVQGLEPRLSRSLPLKPPSCAIQPRANLPTRQAASPQSPRGQPGRSSTPFAERPRSSI